MAAIRQMHSFYEVEQEVVRALWKGDIADLVSFSLYSKLFVESRRF